MNLGLISDTHGLLRPEAVQALEGVQHILHAGDVGRVEILEQLGRIAPMTVVRGNVDNGLWASALAVTALIELAGTTFYVIHDLKELDIDPLTSGVQVVVHGHSHKPQKEERKGVTYINPGSAGPRRFNLPVTLGRMKHEGGEWSFELLRLV